MSDPRVSVVVASHGRADRLPALLDSLALQTLPGALWELVVVHTYPADVAEMLFDRHELGRAGRLRHTRVEGARARPSIQRNVGWRAARGELIVFVDDDCRTTPEWLERLVTASDANPGAIVQGATLPDPLEEHVFANPHVRTLRIHPPSREAQTCNILYERGLLERVGGFDERAITGEDIDLSLRARDAGARIAGEERALAYHAIDGLSLREKVRSQYKWQHLAYVVKRNPRLRDWCAMRVWWKDEHMHAVLALAALALARRRPWALAGLYPYFRVERYRHGTPRANQVRAIREMPAHLVVELAEVATFVVGSVRYRTLLL
ncbi:MAG TPA: glycosyltransferase [Thermoleophilaceae bacterium]|nr:glycosyltransferase [Thermoleophilaceae bacterium]